MPLTLRSAIFASTAFVLAAIAVAHVTAGNQQSFEVASIKPNPASDLARGNFQFDGGLLRATDMPLTFYISYAYNLAPYEERSLTPQLPKWASKQFFDIEARAEGNPTEDQVRLMMQTLLATRFKMVVHTETRDLPVFGLVLIKAGKTGPDLRPHPDDPPCEKPSSQPSAPQVKAAVPCGVLTAGPSSTPGNIRVYARNVTLEQLAQMLSAVPVRILDRPVVDETGLTGKFDFSIDFTRESPRRAQDSQSEQSQITSPALDQGVTFLEALQDQLGLKLRPDRRPMKVLVIDHVEQPSEN
jgi:bla regulator protein BlaR1